MHQSGQKAKKSKKVESLKKAKKTIAKVLCLHMDA